MKFFNFFLFFLCIGGNFLFAQKKIFTLIDTQNHKKIHKKDSLSAVDFLDSLTENRYFLTQIKEIKKKKDTILIFFDKGQDFNHSWVILPPEITEEKEKKIFFTKNLDSLAQKINENFSEKGYHFNKLKTKLLDFKNHFPVVEFYLEKGHESKISHFKIKGYEKIPKKYLKNLSNQFKNHTLNQKKLDQIEKSIKNNPFFQLEKPPMTKLTPDSTLVYLFLKKKKSHTFDGIIGFGNNQTDKIQLNGSIHLSFRNIFNNFEDISIFWQRNPDNVQNFKLNTSIPYIFNTNFGIETKIDILRQDSTYTMVKIHPQIFNQITNNQRFILKGNLELSSTIENQINHKNFSRKGLGLSYENKLYSDIQLFNFEHFLKIDTDFLQTFYIDDENSQSVLQLKLQAEKNFNLSKKIHFLNFSAEMGYLHAKNILAANEIFRIGGWNSFRGFNENALFAQHYFFGGLEYRFLANEQMFFNISTQYGRIYNKNLNISPFLYSFGMGFNFMLPIGILNFQISNGNQSHLPFNFKETKIHWGIISKF